MGERGGGGQKDAFDLPRTDQKCGQDFNGGYPTGPAPVWADAHSLEQILINLLINAAQAADKEDSRSSCAPALPTAGFERFVIEVSDNGRGMDKETRQRVFDPSSPPSPTGGHRLGCTWSTPWSGRCGDASRWRSAPGERQHVPCALPDQDRRANPRK